MKSPGLAFNPHALHSSSPWAMLSGVWKSRNLIRQMIQREVVGRYRGSILGLTWSFVNPLFMLTVYTIVFSEIFKSRWRGGQSGTESRTEFAVVLFVGLIVLNLFSEVINRAPNLILANVNFVKKVVFPLEILPIVALGAALFHSLISVVVLLVAYVTFNGFLPWTVLLFPFVLLPLIVLILGLAWGLASLGVFLRDVGQTISLVTVVLTFLSPIFYPVSAVPEKLRPVIMANPLTFIIEQSRQVLIWGQTPNWAGLGLYGAIAFLVAWIGFAWFQKTRKGFADVI